MLILEYYLCKTKLNNLLYRKVVDENAVAYKLNNIDMCIAI